MQGDPTYLVVYRNRADEVRFVELNAMSSLLLQRLVDNEKLTAAELLADIAEELGMDEAVTIAHGSAQLRDQSPSVYVVPIAAAL